ncbi:MAG: cell division protein ZapA [Nitratireductor sp.]|nr:cell division protein ZapA [Nitratireductor sp.]MCC0022422.1 cell division protein ZapA [Nitratireductor sp.]
MASVSVNINGKTYRMACDEGQEAHLISLAEKLDGYVGQLKGSFGEIGDQRLTVMAGVMVADELVEMEKKVERLEKELAAVKERNKSLSGETEASELEAAKAIEAVAGKLSDLAAKLKS